MQKIFILLLVTYSSHVYTNNFFDLWNSWNKENRDALYKSVTDNNFYKGLEKKSRELSPSAAPSNITFKDIIGGVPQEFLDLKAFLVNDASFKAIGAEQPKGILLVGPSGTGKTMLAQALAGEVNALFLPTSASSFIEIYIGTGPKHIRDLFEKAHVAIAKDKDLKVIIFIDEIDAIGKRGITGNNAEESRTINELLVQMDGYAKNSNIIVMAATNYAELLDQALLRPGRFDYIITIPLPDLHKRIALLEHYLFINNRSVDPHISVADIAEKTHGFNCAEIKDLINKAAVQAARRNKTCIMLEDVETAYQELNKVHRSYRS